MNMKAISPVIATVIIVSVAIAIAVAVAFWMTGITGIFTRYEKLEIVSAYATAKAGGGYTVTVKVRNTGTTTVTIDDVFINGIPYKDVSGASVTLPDALSPGDEGQVTVELPNTFKAGQIVEIKIHTAAGNEYPKSVQLP